jgi:hypothetical protein
LIFKVLCDDTLLAPFADDLNVTVTVVVTDERLIFDRAAVLNLTEVETVPAFLTDTWCVPSVIVLLPDFIVTLMVTVPLPDTCSLTLTAPAA